LEFAVEHAALHDGVKDESGSAGGGLQRLHEGRRVVSVTE
jgi:hypothetical protein